MRMRAPLSLLLVSLLAACDGDTIAPSAQSESPASTSIRDAAHDELVDGFYFLPPMVSQPTTSGTFNPLAAPRVLICRLGADGETCEATTATFTLADGTDGSTLTMSEVDEQFQVDWHTDRFAIDTAAYYRIKVLLTEHPGAQELGHADVKFGSSGKALKNVDTDEYVPLVDGRTLPIKFRIETAICEGGLDCGSGTVGPGGGVVTTANGSAGVLIPEGALGEVVTITIVQLDPAAQTGGRCLPTGIRQDGACYDFSVVGHEQGYQFSGMVTVGVCPSPNALREERLALHKYNPFSAVDVEELPSADETFLRCDEVTGPGYASAAPAGFLGTLAGLARRALGPLGAVLTPRQLHARDIGRAGLTDSFTRFAWAEPITLSVPEGQEVPAAAAPGAILDVTIAALTAHNHDFDDVPTAGTDARIRFDYTPPGEGTPAAWHATTDGGGEASTEWPLTTDPGTHTLVISTRGTDPDPDGAVIGDPTPMLTLQVRVCEDGLDCGTGIIDGDGGVVLTLEGRAGVEFPAGAVDGPITVTIREIGPAELGDGFCLPTGIRQDGPCYEFDTVEEISSVQAGGETTFHFPVAVGICPSPNALREDFLTIHKYDPEREDGVVELVEAAETFLDCSIPVQISRSTPTSAVGRLGNAARRALSPMASLFAPTILHARDIGRAGLTDSFSRFSWAESVTLSADLSSQAQTGAAVTGTVSASTAHDHPQLDPVAASGATLRFEYADGTGLQDTWWGTTNGDGIVPVEFTLSEEPGTHTLTISTRGVDGETLIEDPTPIVEWSVDVTVVAPNTGSFSGTVTNGQGQPLAGAQVALQGTNYATVTNAAGEFMMSSVIPGTYSVSVTLVGYILQYDGTPEVTVTAGGTATAVYQMFPVIE